MYIIWNQKSKNLINLEYQKNQHFIATAYCTAGTRSATLRRWQEQKPTVSLMRKNSNQFRFLTSLLLKQDFWFFSNQVKIFVEKFCNDAFPVRVRINIFAAYIFLQRKK